MASHMAWPTMPAKALFKPQHRHPREGDGIVTAFRDGTVTLRANRRVDGFTNAVQEHGYQGIRCGDLVIHSMDGFAGAIGVSDSDGKASPVVHCYRPTTGVDARYYAYLLRDLAIRGFVTSLAKGIRERSTAFDGETFRSLVLPAPPLEVQRVIADYLDTETARIDALIAKKQRMIELLEGRRLAAIWELLVNANPDPSRIKSLVTKVGSGSTPRGGADVYVDEGVAFLRSQNVREGRVMRDDVVFITEEDDAAMPGTRVRDGDVLLNITGGSIGRTAVVTAADLPANVSQHVCILRPAEGVEAKVLQAALDSKSVREQISLMQVGGNREGLNFEQVRNLEVHVPLSGAEAPTREIEHVNETHRRETSLLDRQIELLRERRQALITAAVTGELEVPGVAA